MPFFGNKFTSKKTPVRKSLSEIGRDPDSLQYKEFLENDAISLTLGDIETTFKDGQWIPESGSTGKTHIVNQKLRDKLDALKEENNLYKIKFDVLLDMLTQTTAENHLQQREIEKLHKSTKE